MEIRYDNHMYTVLPINVNVNVRHTYWAPLNPVTEALHAVELTSFLWRMPEGVAEHSFSGCNHQSTCITSYSLRVQLLWYPMYYPGKMKARVSPVQWSKPYIILAPTQDSNPGGWIQNTKRWPLHYHCTTRTHVAHRSSTLLNFSVFFKKNNPTPHSQPNSKTSRKTFHFDFVHRHATSCIFCYCQFSNFEYHIQDNYRNNFHYDCYKIL